MVVTEVEVEVDTELPTDVENCVAVAELSHDISSTTIPLFRGFCELCSRGVEGKGREERTRLCLRVGLVRCVRSEFESIRVLVWARWSELEGWGERRGGREGVRKGDGKGENGKKKKDGRTDGSLRAKRNETTRGNKAKRKEETLTNAARRIFSPPYLTLLPILTRPGFTAQSSCASAASDCYLRRRARSSR